ncbi:glycoside hydrolase family 25 protein [Streptomyces sp. 900105245]
MIHGIDVSVYNSPTPDLTGMDFVFIKATEGTGYANAHRASQATTGRNARVVVGFYHFARPGDINAQARFFVDRAAPLDGEILAIDWEDPKVPSADKDALLKAVKKLRPNHRVILYCNIDFWHNRDTSSFAQDGLWIADYGCPAGQPRLKHPWSFHQYADKPTTDQNVAQFPSRSALSAWANADTAMS